MTSSALTVQSLAESIYDDMMTNIIRQVTLNTVSRYRTLQQCVEGDYFDAISPTRSTGNRDIFGNDKTKLKNSETHVRDDLTQCIQDGADSNPSPKVAGTDILLCSSWGSTKQASSIYELFAGYH
ncbi:SAGA-associated factor [Candidozyma auris]